MCEINAAWTLGASTGGFTDCLLQSGASRVIAVDTGYGQMDARLRSDPRVQLLEKTNARYLTPEQIWADPETREPVSLVAMDVSFISATLVLPAVVRCARASSSGNGFELVLLVKPQFEVGRGQVGKGGIVRDALAQQTAVTKVADAVEALGRYGGRGHRVSDSWRGGKPRIPAARPLSRPSGKIVSRATLTCAIHMKSVAIISKPSKTELAGILPELLGWFRSRGYQLYLDQETAQYTNGEEVVPRQANRRQASRFCPGAGWRRHAAFRGARRRP